MMTHRATCFVVRSPRATSSLPVPEKNSRDVVLFVIAMNRGAKATEAGG
jgi:hypothetical protein